MKQIIPLALFLLSAGGISWAQENKKVDQEQLATDTSLNKAVTEKIENPEKLPSFPGGEEALLKFVNSNAIYPHEAKKNNISGKVYVSFIIDKEGNVKDAKILRGIGGGCDEEALRVIRLMPQWTPGTQDGRPVDVQFNLPIKFGLQ